MKRFFGLVYFGMYLIFAIPVMGFDTEIYNGQAVVKNRLLIKFVDPNNIQERDRILNKIGGIFKGGNNDMLPFSIVQLACDTGIDTAILIIQNDTAIYWVNPDYVGEYFFNPIYPTDTNLVDQYYLDQASDNDIDAPEAWGRMDNPGGRSDVIIAVLDSGVQLTHQDLVKNFYKDIADPIDGVDNDGDGYTDEYDGFDFYQGTLNDNGTPNIYTDDKWINSDTGPEDLENTEHGTMVSGIIGASINDTNHIQSVVGIAYNCKILPIKMGPNPTTLGSLSGIYFAVKQGAKVINCSYGGYIYSDAENEAIQYALNSGLILVCASGDDNADLDNVDCYPIEYSADIIGVGSVGKTGYRSTFSNYGWPIDLVAFGEDITTTKINGYAINDPTMDGTSFSAPQVAAAAVLLLSEKPSLTRSEVERILKETAIDRGAAYWDEYYGAGILNLVGAIKMTQFATRKDYQVVTYPSPFRVQQGGYCVIEPTEAAKTIIANVFTTSGRLVRRLDDSTEVGDFDSDGSVEARWNGLNEEGDRVVPGVYVIGVVFDGRKTQGRITVINW
ncbi:MAG: S8 family serine peptidase [Candidatus Hydrogenedentota bacterium]